MIDDPAVVATIRPDREVAANLKNEMQAALAVAAGIMDVANRSGMKVQFQLGIDGFGRNVIASLDIVKVF